MGIVGSIGDSVPWAVALPSSINEQTPLGNQQRFNHREATIND
jgi:hypothetical protein